MSDQGNIMELRNEEEDSNSDYGSLSPISSPGTLRWMEYVRSEIVQGQIEHPIHFDPPNTIPVPALPTNFMDMLSSSIPQVSFPYRFLDSQVPASPTNYKETWSSFSVSFPEFSGDCRLPISQGFFPNLGWSEESFRQSFPDRRGRQDISFRVLKNCKNLHEDPGWIQNTSSLRGVQILIFGNLIELPDWIKNISSFEVLEVQNFQKLTELLDWIKNISSLERLEKRNCQKLTEFLVNTLDLNWFEQDVEKNNSLRLVMEAELAFSFRNIMNSAIQYAISQAFSSSKSNHNDRSFVACEGENKLFLAQATKSRENGSQSIQSFIPCGSTSEFSPCRVAPVVYILYQFEALKEDFTVLGSMFDIATSFQISSFKFSYHAEHSSPGHAQGYHLHAILSMSLLVRLENSPLGLFEIVHCPCNTSFPSKHQGWPGPNKKRQSVLSPYLDSTTHQGSSNERQKLLDSVQTFTYSAHASCKSIEVIAHTQTNNQHKRKESTTTWSTYGLISLQDLEQHYGQKREKAAESLQVSVSTFKRICRKHGIRRWPTAKRKREKSVISAQKCDVSLRVAGEEQASTPQSPNAFPSSLQPFSLCSTAIETHLESSPCSSLSKHREGNPSHNLNSLSKHREGNPSHNLNMLGNYETTKENDMSQGRALAEESRQCKERNGSLPVESLMPDALVKTSQPPQNGTITCEDSETSSMSRQKRKRLEKETGCMNEVTRFEEQSSEIQNGNPKRQAIGFASKGSSCLSSISGTIEGNKGYNHNSKSITGYGIVDDMDSACTGVQLIVDDMDSTCMGVPPKDDTNSTLVEGQPSLKSTSTWPLNSLSSSGNTVQNIKLHFDKLIALPLGDLVNPEKESYMMKALSILADNLSLFSEEQAEQILGLLFDFPGLANSWREYSQSQIYSQKSSAETDKIQELVETSMNDEEHLKVRYEELEMKEKELLAQLEAVQKEKASIAEQMHEKFKQTKDLVSLAEEKAAASRTKDKHMMKVATTKLNNLVVQWARIQSFFM